MRRRVCVISGSRADYGPLKPLLYLLNKDKDIRLQLVVTGSHLSSRFGLTYKEIEKDGFAIDAKIGISLISDSPQGIARSTGIAIAKLSDIYAKLRPDIIVVLGDRFEIFGAAAAACIKRVPIAHISGGEITEGSIDDVFRHCITKMSHLHFTALETYRRRVIQLGESPDRVFKVGEIGLDGIRKVNFVSKKDLEAKMKFRFHRRNLLITFHPATAGAGVPERQFANLLRALKEQKDTGMIFTKANADEGGAAINKLIYRYVRMHRPDAAVFASLGRTVYLSAMRCVDAVVGNSSSGLLEAPSLRIGTINIGDRQSGRIRAESVIDCEPAFNSIRRSFKRLYSKAYRDMLKRVKNPYEGNMSPEKVLRVLKICDLAELRKKKFYDIGNT